jgi:hypothetical protein
MKKYQSKNFKEVKITINKIEYGFILHEEGIGIRRIDQKKPTEKEVDFVTSYITSEGWGDNLNFNNEDFGGLV